MRRALLWTGLGVVLLCLGLAAVVTICWLGLPKGITVNVDVAALREEVRVNLSARQERLSEPFPDQRHIERSYEDDKDFRRTEFAGVCDSSPSWLIRGDI